MRTNWLCGKFYVYASSFENYIAEKVLKNSFAQQSRSRLLWSFFDGEQIFPDQANNFKIFLVSKMANTY